MNIISKECVKCPKGKPYHRLCLLQRNINQHVTEGRYHFVCKQRRYMYLIKESQVNMRLKLMSKETGSHMIKRTCRYLKDPEISETVFMQDERYLPWSADKTYIR